MSDDALREWGDSRRLPPPTPAEAQALVERARGRRSSVRWLVAAVGAGGLGVAAVAALVVARVATPEVAPPPVELADLPPVAVELPPPVPVERVLTTGEHRVGDDVLRVDGELVVGDLLELRRGTVTVTAAPRTDDTLAVQAGAWTVEVVGTVFTVEREPFAVAVTEGVVAVVRDADRWTLRAGDRFADGRVVRPVAPPAVPAVADLRAQLLRGEEAEARAGLAARLAVHPDDADAWTLSAQLEARAGDPTAAVAAWRQVIAHGDAASAQRARYEAAVLLDDDPAAAVPLLAAFLADPGALGPEARLRLGRAQLALGDLAAGRRTLEALVAAHPGTASATVARTLLDAM